MAGGPTFQTKDRVDREFDASARAVTVAFDALLNAISNHADAVRRHERAMAKLRGDVA